MPSELGARNHMFEKNIIQCILNMSSDIFETCCKLTIYRIKWVIPMNSVMNTITICPCRSYCKVQRDAHPRFCTIANIRLRIDPPLPIVGYINEAICNFQGSNDRKLNFLQDGYLGFSKFWVLGVQNVKPNFEKNLIFSKIWIFQKNETSCPRASKEESACKISSP